MRKTYKPQSKQNKLTNTYRKKTIDPGVDLDIKKDKDDMDNIDDYWNMAEYVMEDDKTNSSVVNVPEDAKKLVNKANKKVVMENMESSMINDVMEISTDDGNMTSGQSVGNYELKDSPVKIKGKDKKINDSPVKKKINDSPVKNKIKNSPVKKKINDSPVKNNIKNSPVKKKKSKKQGKDEKIKDSPLKNSQPKKSKKENKSEKFDKINNSLVEHIGSPLRSSIKSVSNTGSPVRSSIKSVSNTSGFRTETSHNYSNDDVNKSEMFLKSQKAKKRNNPQSSINMSRESTESEFVFKGETIVCNDKICGMTKVSSLFEGKSKLEPLITKRSLESGILFLRPGASIQNELADVTFTIFVLKGSVDIIINKSKVNIKKESCFIIEENTHYSIYDVSRDGSSIFVTFRAR